ncbi:N-acetylmuramoyl-L-alanine amidase [Oleiagrimonas sp.]|jgi:N-acetylmuramoyl-L-alanine amidase|uniref:N-acetylmuramoyl-L-alanine amidase n=1 Tax=Oleiagrimonas sp. TaxID=2010330 RepID=UPI002632E555|nr:N-acetylmuramoyl-L-alanine amidase [Oleiagrimonas sp.]MDA3913865.1 N-acetylmuramoyl-L-alanine amidase [Oleiagrimonas sp.]
MSSLIIHDWPLPYVDRLEPRPLDAVDLVVIHCTELPDLDMARAYGERVRYPSGTGNSGHYYVDRDGRIHRFVPDDRVAHHVRAHNAHAIGIEMVNTGRYPHWLDHRHQQMAEAYPDAQIENLCALLDEMAARLPDLHWIAGHEDLDTERVEASDDPSMQVPRKRDPGPLFPWQHVLSRTRLQRLMPDTASA